MFLIEGHSFGMMNIYLSSSGFSIQDMTKIYRARKLEMGEISDLEYMYTAINLCTFHLLETRPPLSEKGERKEREK